MLNGEIIHFLIMYDFKLLINVMTWFSHCFWKCDKNSKYICHALSLSLVYFDAQQLVEGLLLLIEYVSFASQHSNQFVCNLMN